MLNHSEEDGALHESVKSNTAIAQEEATGYLHPLYCQSLSEFGTPRLLNGSGGWILERQIPKSPHLDAMGCYPLFACRDWSRLHADLESIRDLVSLSVVTDPFGEYDAADLQQSFPDLTIPFKEHLVVDLSRALDTFVHSDHRRKARRALSEMDVERCIKPENHLEEWTTLYSTLVKKRNITGIPAFSRESFASQLRVPGIVAFRALRDSSTLGMLLWYVYENRAYYHLGAYSEAGYDLNVSFALFWLAIENFSTQNLAWLNLGAGAGISGNRQEDGLSRFKRGWATGRRTAYFCGKIFDQQRYKEIMKSTQAVATNYFPAYRKGEFG